MLSFFRVLSGLALSALPLVAASAQEGQPAQAAQLCADPPLTEAALDRVRRRADYGRILDAIAGDCPEVAMLFSVFVVGEVDRAPHEEVQRHPPDFLNLIGPEQAFSCCDVAAIP